MGCQCADGRMVSHGVILSNCTGEEGSMSRAPGAVSGWVGKVFMIKSTAESDRLSDPTLSQSKKHINNYPMPLV